MDKPPYGAVLDINDTIYGGFKAKSPVIVFDMVQVIPKDVYRTKPLDQISQISCWQDERPLDSNREWNRYDR